MSRPRVLKRYWIAFSFEEGRKIVEAALIVGKAADIARCPQSLWNNLPVTATLHSRRHAKMQVSWPWIGGPMLTLTEILEEILLFKENGDDALSVTDSSGHETTEAAALISNTFQRIGMAEPMISELLDLSKA